MDAVIGYILSAFAGFAFGGASVWFFLGRKGGEPYEDGPEQRGHLLRGAYMALSEKWEDAAREFKEAARVDPGREDVYFVLGNLFRRMGDYARAIRIHQGMALRAAKTGTDIRHKALFELAEDYAAAGSARRAMDTLQKLAESARTWPEPRHRLAELAIRAEDWTLALESLSRYESLGGRDAKDLLARVRSMEALRLLEADDIAGAGALVKAARQRSPHLALVHLADARFRMAKDQPKKALRALRKGLEVQPQAAPALLREMELISKEGGILEGFELFLRHRLEDGSPYERAVRRQLARRRLEEGDRDAARRYVESLLDDDDLHPDTVRLAEKLELTDRLNEETSSRFACRSCGKPGDRPDWFCPECASWDSYFQSEPARRLS